MTSKTNTMDRHRGVLLILSGPSGVGKGTVSAALRENNSDLIYSVSATTRQPRKGEQEGVDYFFKSKEQFEQMIARNEMLEWAEYVGNYYGTPKQFVEEKLQSGKNVILEIEVQGAQKIKQKSTEGVFIFLLPPSIEELKKRITSRGSESDETIALRMSTAINEIRMIEQYDYAIINDEVELACSKIQSILIAERCSKERLYSHIMEWINEVKS
jgi:guanylate kinase